MTAFIKHLPLLEHAIVLNYEWKKDNSLKYTTNVMRIEKFFFHSHIFELLKDMLPSSDSLVNCYQKKICPIWRYAKPHFISASMTNFFSSLSLRQLGV